MNWLKIRNSGELALEALFLLGASTKRGQEGKIGFFGSGNKYALAVLLRLGIPFRIFSGEREVKIEVRDVDFRGQAFGQILLDGQPTSFTTSMGPTWEPWFAVREFLCNALDEGGAEWLVLDDGDFEDEGFAGEAGATSIYVGLDRPELLDFVANMDTYIRPAGAENLYEASAPVYWGRPYIGIFNAPGGKQHFYRRGVLVSPVDEPREAIFSYDFSECAINESRIASSEWDLTLAIKYVLAGSTCEEVVSRVVAAILGGRDVFEAGINFGGVTLSETWSKVFAALGQQLVPEGMVSYMPLEDQGHFLTVPDSLYDQLAEQFSDVLDFRTKSSKSTPAELSPEDRRFLDEALAALAGIGYTTDFPIVAVEFRDNDVRAETDPGTRRISIAASEVQKCAETRNIQRLKAILFEEIMHTKGFNDGSRGFEQELIRIAIDALESGAVAKAKLVTLKTLL